MKKKTCYVLIKNYENTQKINIVFLTFNVKMIFNKHMINTTNNITK